MEHVLINTYGYSLGVKGNRLEIKKAGRLVKEIGLNKLKTIQINSSGIHFSSDVIYALSANNVKIFFSKANNCSSLHTMYEHKTASVRQAQYGFCNVEALSTLLAKDIIKSKIKNQRAAIIYAARNIKNGFKSQSINMLDNLLTELSLKNDKQSILGIEGKAADIYFTCLQGLNLFPKTFEYRTKRNSTEITNVSLNYGYAILRNRLYDIAVKSGFDPFCGILHVNRSGRPALILDIMEQYRSYIVDRSIIKLKDRIEKASNFNDIKAELANEILKRFEKYVVYAGSEITVENVIKKQINKLKAHICSNKEYSSYVFRW